MSQVWRAIGLAALWLSAAMLSLSMVHVQTQTTPVWLSSGITFAALLVSARWQWPAWLIGAVLAAWLWGLTAHELPLAGAAALAVAETFSVVLGVWVARLSRPDPLSPHGVALLLTGVGVTAVVGASLATGIWSWQRPDAQLSWEWRTWALSTAVGLLLVVPLVTAFRGFRVRRSGGLRMPPFLAGAATFLIFGSTVLLVFANQPAQRWGTAASTLAYVPMPFLLLTALFWGPRGGALAALLGALLIIERTAHGGGPFALHESFPGEAVVEVQGFVLAWAMVLLVSHALAEAGRVAARQAQEWRLRYERTLQAVAVASVEYDARTGQATWGEAARAVLGSAIDGVTSVQAWLDLIDPADRALVQATWQEVSEGRRASSEQSYQVRGPAGSTLRVRERLASVRGGDGEIEQVVALLSPVRQEPIHG
ncbi:MASE1 domain-containing protein [Roseateles amylovorans]|uniref:MASE1 domain-containing protein n=1 Tax=Roseateles amylovorans TaxID=2978473 RepID=A0ABY6B0M6_9BURK|nr:MASE1 domain-containing protein [Roseateles amylovorans]UXH78390.1 MASE1 domain-containing protein [Roseateles amylovorans]